MKAVLFVSILTLLVACGKDNKTEEGIASSAIRCIGNQPVDQNGNPINTFNQNQNIGSIYNTNGYCQNGQWVTTNNQNQTGYRDANNNWVTTGPYVNNGSGYVPYNTNNDMFYQNTGAWYRHPNTQSNGWSWSWHTWD